MDFEIMDRTEDEDYELPSYSDPGSILVKLLNIVRDSKTYDRYELEVVEYDSGTCLMWMQEGIGIEYWIQEAVDFRKPGYYVIEHVTGTYYRGDGYTTDDDEEWNYKCVRRATLREQLFKRLY